ncbi:MAG: amino acid adenylation domain-containing protein, partial [Clostridia bacterium]|nr:amino acid adenylation domain-containing protein [Clostridia bacterium]
MKTFYNLTDQQREIWNIEQYYKNTTINNISGTLIIKQKVDFEKLRKSINIFVQKNDSFRTRILIKDGEPKQLIKENLQFSIKEENLINKDELNKIENEIVSTPFNLINSNLFEFTIIKYNDGTGGFNANVHHIISDAWTMSLLINQIINIYEKLINNEEIEEDISPSYLEKITSNEEYKKSEKYIKDREYWENTFKDIPETACILPYMCKEQNLDAKRKEYTVEQNLSQKIGIFCERNKVSIYSFLMSIYSFYLSRVSGIETPIIGTPILNRKNFREKNTTGMFVSTITNKINVNNELKFIDFLFMTAKTQREIFKHQEFGYEGILKLIRKRHNTSARLYDVMLSYQNARNNSDKSKISYETNWIFNNYLLNSLLINIYDMDNTGKLKIFYDYQKCKFLDKDIDNIHKRILHIFEQVVSNENIKINDIEIVTLDEKQKLLFDFNNTEKHYEKDKTIHQLFEEQVNKTPNEIAIVCGNNQLTYKELNEKANQLAHYLRKNKDIRKNDIIGIMINRSLEMIVGIIAILKSGAAYLPLDPEYPEDRIIYILEDSSAKMVLVNNTTENMISKKIDKTNISLENSLFTDESKENLKNVNIATDLIYLIYTSGSTGNPKGVMLNHKNINNYICGLKEKIDFSEDKTMVSITTICFDIFVTEIWATLLNGIKVILANENEQNIPKLLSELCEENTVNMIQTTPSRFDVLINSDSCEFLKNMSDILVGGESLNDSLLYKLKSLTKANIYNMYGPTETSVWSTVKELTKTNEITIGKPIINTQVYILDKSKRLLPPNIIGEIYIGGDGVSDGYLNREELTKEKFVQVPFALEKIYNTNDIGYVKNNGEVVHLGRSDFQIKINGHRIELGEIENVILKFKNISNCVVIAKKNEYGKESIYAYYTAKEIINITILREFLQNKLPQYMIPQYFMQLEELPYTPNGKIDRKKLPDIKIKSKECIQKANT